MNDWHRDYNFRRGIIQKKNKIALVLSSTDVPGMILQKLINCNLIKNKVSFQKLWTSFQKDEYCIVFFSENLRRLLVYSQKFKVAELDYVTLAE